MAIARQLIALAERLTQTEYVLLTKDGYRDNLKAERIKSDNQFATMVEQAAETLELWGHQHTRHITPDQAPCRIPWQGCSRPSEPSDASPRTTSGGGAR